MEDLMVQFGMSVRSIKQTLLFRGTLDAHQCTALLERLSREIAEAETQADHLQQLLANENDAIAQAENLITAVKGQESHQKYILSHLPTYLPSSAASATVSSSRMLSDVRNQQGAYQTDRGTATNSNKPPTTSSASNSSVHIPTIAIVKVDEFEATPTYIRGRVNRDHVNDCIQAIQAVIAAKYKILAVPRSKHVGSTLKRYDAFKDAETEETKGVVFFVEDDIKTLSEFRLDTAGRTCLNVLRHLGRIKEHRSAGLLRYVVV